ncbi:MAG: putative 4-hydroxybenzoate polyprenyltransferase [Spirochaetes bacterium]|nr:putative 4-hydroxybenzoate polyprenyltransferase [Spirochaetota bacterium]
MKLNFKIFAKRIMIVETLFALPFAWLGVLFAGGGEFMTWVWVSLALAAGRTAGMSFNRLIDEEIDGRNPRTAGRALPAGQLSRRDVWILAGVSCALLVFASYMLNTLCFQLSFAVIALLFTYSYFKRFTTASHFYLGFIEAAAPVGGYIAVTGMLYTASRVDLIPFILGAAIMFWIAGLDIVYALLDIHFDRRAGLLSIPVKYGREKALILSHLLYVLSAAAMVAAGVLARRQQAYWMALACVAVIFVYQQRLARKDDQEAAVKELFQINAFISPVLFVGTFIDVFVRYQ